jgi:hypothetical protein
MHRAALLHVLEVKDPSSRTARWQVYFQGYNFTVEHRRGRDHLGAGALPRSPHLLPVNTVLPELDSELPTLDATREAQVSDRVLQGYTTLLEGQLTAFRKRPVRHKERKDSRYLAHQLTPGHYLSLWVTSRR